LRTGLVDAPGQRKIHDQPIPLAGGLAVMTGFLLPAIGAVVWLLGHTRSLPSVTMPAAAARGTFPLDAAAVSLLGYGLNRRALELGGIVVGALGMMLVGWIDDKHELKPHTKFAGQLLIALLVAASGVRITLFVQSAVFHYAITVLWMLTVINAFNFMDNMNGLSAGLGVIGAWYFATLAAAEGQYLVALIVFLTFGALLGFLPYNFPRAWCFLGDAGSHLIGYLLSVLAILPHFYTAQNPRKWAVLIPLCVLGLPLIDLVWVVLLRWRMGRPFYVGDTNHLSHRLVRLGLSRTRAVLLIWLLAALLGGCCLVFT
jgi:UDP-GlcNAc:undecaprenyl-phosphate/decaprenyl-phosphate GlcNAc-1-phosphate transferase